MHQADVEYDVGSLGNLNAVDVVILQSFSHCEVNHRMEPHGLIYEALEHCQFLQIKIFHILITCKKEKSNTCFFLHNVVIIVIITTLMTHMFFTSSHLWRLSESGDRP